VEEHIQKSEQRPTKNQAGLLTTQNFKYTSAQASFTVMHITTQLRAYRIGGNCFSFNIHCSYGSQWQNEDHKQKGSEAQTAPLKWSQGDVHKVRTWPVLLKTGLLACLSFSLSKDRFQQLQQKHAEHCHGLNHSTGHGTTLEFCY